MKTFIIGTLTSVGEVEVKDNYKQQRIEVTVREFDTATGQEKPAQVFPATIFNKKVDELRAMMSKTARVKIECYLKSLKSEKDGKVFYNIALNVVGLTEIQ